MSAARNTHEPDVDDLDAWECPECGGAGRVTVYHKVTHQLGTDELPFWDECAVCTGVGYCGPDAERRAAIAKATPTTQKATS